MSACLNKVCEACGCNFYVSPDEGWKRKCITCWKAEAGFGHKPADIDKLRAEVTRLKNDLAKARTALAEAEEALTLRSALQQQWRRLALLCHPDRHGNSVAATEATRWLLEIRRQVRP